MDTGRSQVVLAPLVLTKEQFVGLQFWLISQDNMTEDFANVLAMRHFDCVEYVYTVKLEVAFEKAGELDNIDFIETINQQALFKFSSVVKKLYDILGLTKVLNT